MPASAIRAAGYTALSSSDPNGLCMGINTQMQMLDIVDILGAQAGVKSKSKNIFTNLMLNFDLVFRLLSLKSAILEKFEDSEIQKILFKIEIIRFLLGNRKF